MNFRLFLHKNNGSLIHSKQNFESTVSLWEIKSFGQTINLNDANLSENNTSNVQEVSTKKTLLLHLFFGFPKHCLNLCLLRTPSTTITTTTTLQRSKTCVTIIKTLLHARVPNHSIPVLKLVITTHYKRRLKLTSLSGIGGSFWVGD